jgi:uncharacterized membrane protein
LLPRARAGFERKVLMMVIWVAAAVAAGVVAWKLIGGRQGFAARERSPEEILKERFARGEIDGAEFERRMNALHGRAT